MAGAVVLGQQQDVLLSFPLGHVEKEFMPCRQNLGSPHVSLSDMPESSAHQF